ncbi:MAG: hypothetical protein K8R90_10670 [Candidatus Cloacimonetes bacterium]|nr:hypothetical protein [Candidatus Cloacimonadota bacterium]
MIETIVVVIVVLTAAVLLARKLKNSLSGETDGCGVAEQCSGGCSGCTLTRKDENTKPIKTRKI